MGLLCALPILVFPNQDLDELDDAYGAVDKLDIKEGLANDLPIKFLEFAERGLAGLHRQECYALRPEPWRLRFPPRTAGVATCNVSDVDGTLTGMSHDSFALIGDYHRNLPQRIIDYLHRRGISDEIIATHRIGWNGQRIAIPIFDRDGEFAFFKLAKDPEDGSGGPKMLTTRGGTVELYGWEQALLQPSRLVICEGEFDRLVLETRGLPAVTSTGGAGSFRAEWATALEAIPEIYLCLDRDEAGRNGALRIGQFLPNAKMVDLPEAVGIGGDVTDFFVRLGYDRDDFLKLLDTARPVPTPPAALPVSVVPRDHLMNPFSVRVSELKRAVPIADVVSRYVILRPSGLSLRGRCPFHDDHTPSLMVYAEAGKFRCYGCGRHGDVIEFLMTIEQLPFLRALDALDDFQSQTHEQPSAQQ